MDEVANAASAGLAAIICLTTKVAWPAPFPMSFDTTAPRDDISILPSVLGPVISSAITVTFQPADPDSIANKSASSVPSSWVTMSTLSPFPYCGAVWKPSIGLLPESITV